MIAASQRPVVVFVYGDDWQGLYVEDLLVTEGHQVSTNDALEAVQNLGVFQIGLSIEADQEWLESEGSLAAALADVKRA